jgi:hypothetical protein
MDTQDQFEKFKRQFQPALDYLEREKVQLQALNVQDDRLLVRAVAPSAEMRDKIIEQFRRIDPESKQFHADIRIEAEDNVPSSGQSTVQSTGVFSETGETPR